MLKFIATGLISAVLAGGAIYLAMDEDTAARLRSERTVDAPVTSAPQPARQEDASRRSNEPRQSWLDGFRLPRESGAVPARNAPTPQTFDLLIDQAEQIPYDYARDDAYYSILTYALSLDQVDVAERLSQKMSTSELRDTARLDIGVAHARAGRMDEAFSVIDALETEALVESIRLQIIKAATNPGEDTP